MWLDRSRPLMDVNNPGFSVEKGTTGQNLRHHYALDQPWNSNETLIKLAGYPSAILDGNTNEFLFWASIPSSATWANTNPDLMYGTSKNKLVRYNVNKNTSETLHTFSGYTSIDYGRNKGNMSIDDKYIGLIGMNGSNQTLIVYNIESNQVVGTKDVGTLGFNWFSVSPTGAYAVLYFEEDGKSVNEGINVMEIDLTNLRHLNDYTTHSDLGINSDGDDIFIAFGDPITRPKDYYMKMVRLSDGLVTPFFHYTKSQGIWGGHISCRNTDRPGWAYVSDAVTTTVAQKEIFAIKLDGSDQIERFAIYHSDYIKGYGHQAHAVPNRNGTKVMFASNWNNAFTGNYPPSFIVQAPITLKADDEAIPGNIMVYPNPSKDGLIHIKPHSSIVIEAIIVTAKSRFFIMRV